MKKHILTIVLSIIIGILLLSMVGKKLLTSSYKVSAAQQAQMLVSPNSQFSLLELDLAIKANNPDVLFIDLRSQNDYSKGHLPNAINIPTAELFSSDNYEYIKSEDVAVKVLYADYEHEASKALSLLIMKGYSNFKVLSGGYLLAKNYVIDNPTPSYYHVTDEQVQFNYSRLMPAGSVSGTQTASEPPVIDISAPRGGC